MKKITDAAADTAERAIEQLLRRHLMDRQQREQTKVRDAEQQRREQDRREKAQRAIADARRLRQGKGAVFRDSGSGVREPVSLKDLSPAELVKLDRILDGAFEHTPDAVEQEKRMDEAGNAFVRFFDHMRPEEREMLVAHVMLFNPRDIYAELVTRHRHPRGDETIAKAHGLHAAFMENTETGRRLIEEAKMLGLYFQPLQGH